MVYSRKTSLLLSLLVGLSAIFTLARSGPLHGSTAALIVTVALQVYLPGFLLARALGKTHQPHPIVRFAWVLVCGLSLTIVFGAAARLLYMPVSRYLLLLHALMLGLAWLPPLAAPAEPAWRLTRKNWPLYIVVLVACVTVMGVSFASSRYRFYGYEDQVVFVSHAGWLANDISETPHGGPLRSRQVGVIRGDTRFDTDGWTYNHGAWSWASGVSTADIIWYHLDPLFLWAVPLVIFALAYELTRREQAAAWSTAGLVLAGLLTLDNLALYPAYTAFGRFAVFQITTLRQASLTLMLPLALMVGFSYLRRYQHRDLFLLVLAGMMLASMHPFQVMLFVISIGITAGLRGLVEGNKRKAFIRLLPLGAALLFLLVLPFVQRLNRSGLEATSSFIDDSDVEDGKNISLSSGGTFVILPDVPLIGDTFIRLPSSVFYHPVIALAAVLGLLHLVGVRRSLSAQYIFGATLTCLLIAFTPGLTELFDKFASSVGLLTSIFLLPVALALGLSLDAGLRWLAEKPYINLTWPVGAAFIGAVILLLVEPVPIRASARDQIQTFTDMQQFRRLQPHQIALAERLQSLLPPDQTSVLMTPPDTASIVIEDLPRTLVTGGRISRNRARYGDNRFYNNLNRRMPWLDADDLAFMDEWGVTHIIVRADHTRLPQLLLQPERFSLIDEVDGQLIFARAAAEPDSMDELFARMNALYADIEQPRWGIEGFVMNRPGSPEIWGPMAEEWQALLDAQPDNDRARLGLAFAELLAGADDRALPLWQELYDAHPDMPLLLDALAYTHAGLGQPEQGVAALLDALEGGDVNVQTLAARTLLTETFFHLLDAEQLDRVLAFTASDTWNYLANFDQPEAIRRRGALLMTMQRWDTAIAWLNQLPDIMINPRDMAAQAIMRLAQNNVEGALDLLRPATDPDWRVAREKWQPDRWADNQAERLYHQLTDAAAYAGDIPDGVTEVVPMVAVAESGNPFVSQPEAAQREADHTLIVTASYGNPQPHTGYPVQFWRIEVISPDAATHYAAQDVPAVFVENALARVSTTLTLPDDLDPLTPALVVITPAHNNAVTYTPAIVPVVLNRPDSLEPSPDYHPLDLAFGDDIWLQGYTLNTTDEGIGLTLYWQADAQPPEDYQVFVHVLDAAGEMIAQDDGAPVQDRYPTSQWRTGVTIADQHMIPVENLPDDFQVYVGLYRLSDNTRLPVTPADARVQSDSVLLTPLAE
jgi:tetratricopeptide (TPR) repeat protein